MKVELEKSVDDVRIGCMSAGGCFLKDSSAYMVLRAGHPLEPAGEYTRAVNLESGCIVGWNNFSYVTPLDLKAGPA